MKTCFKCGGVFPPSEFYRHAQMGDGHLNKCKVCTKRDVKARYEVKREDPEWITQERARGREKFTRLGYAERYRGRDTRRHLEAWKARYPEKCKAQQAVANAVRDGRLVRPTQCQECGAGGRIHGHHPDYSKPLEVMWLCPQCHGLQHRKEAA
jgi:hypothetical protein